MPPPFWEVSPCRVTTHVGISRGSHYPTIEVNEDYEVELIQCRLSKAGYGSITEIEQWTAKKVLTALAYEAFCSDYEDAYLELNRD